MREKENRDMTRMKLAIASAAVLALLAGTGYNSMAEQGPGMGPKWGHGTKHCKAGAHFRGPGAQLDMLTARLTLSEEQRIKLLPILDEQFAKKKAIREDGSLTRDQRRAKMEELHTTYHGKISAILTPEQKIKADEMRAAAMQHGKGRKGDMHRMDPATRLEKMSTCLGLTADQKAKMAPILAEQSREMKALHDDAKLTRDQKMQKMQDLRAKYHDKIGMILSPEQKAKIGTKGMCNDDGRGMGHGPMMHDNKPATPPAK
jgi:Spy/CpxP family protein refolding chaperone